MLARCPAGATAVRVARGDRQIEYVVTVDRGSGMVSAPVTIPAVAAAPALFTLNTQGTGMAAAVNQDGTVNGLSNPAAKAFLGVISR